MSERKKVIIPPINLMFKLLQNRSLVTIWLFEQTNTRIEGYIQGFDEFMNIVVDNAVEIYAEQRTEIGRIMLKGDNVTLIASKEI